MPQYLVTDSDRFLELLAALIWQALRDMQHGDADAGQWVIGGGLDALLYQCGLDLTAQHVLRVGDVGSESFHRRREVRGKNHESMLDSAGAANHQAPDETERKARDLEMWIRLGEDPAAFESWWQELWGSSA